MFRLNPCELSFVLKNAIIDNKSNKLSNNTLKETEDSTINKKKERKSKKEEEWITVVSKS